MTSYVCSGCGDLWHEEDAHDYEKCSQRTWRAVLRISAAEIADRKEALREADSQALASGAKTPAQLRRENGIFSGVPIIRVHPPRSLLSTRKKAMSERETYLEVLANIAKKTLNISTLETRNRDSLDFYDVSVWSVRDALETAYLAGRASREAAANRYITIHISPSHIGPETDLLLRDTIDALVDEGLFHYAAVNQLFPHDEVLELQGIYTVSCAVSGDLQPALARLRQVPGIAVHEDVIRRSVAE